MDDFFSWVFCVLLTLAICVGCSMGETKQSLTKTLEAIGKFCPNGFDKVELDTESKDPKLQSVSCHPRAVYQL